MSNQPNPTGKSSILSNENVNRLRDMLKEVGDEFTKLVQALAEHKEEIRRLKDELREEREGGVDPVEAACGKAETVFRDWLGDFFPEGPDSHFRTEKVLYYLVKRALGEA